MKKHSYKEFYTYNKAQKVFYVDNKFRNTRETIQYLMDQYGMYHDAAYIYVKAIESINFT